MKMITFTKVVQLEQKVSRSSEQKEAITKQLNEYNKYRTPLPHEGTVSLRCVMLSRLSLVSPETFCAVLFHSMHNQ